MIGVGSENKKIVKKYFKKYFESNYLEERDLEFKSLVRILNKVQKIAIKSPLSGSYFRKEVEEMLDEIIRLSRYNSNHDKILDNFGDIGIIVRKFKKKHMKHIK